MDDETERPAQIAPKLGERTATEMNKADTTGINRRRLILTTIKAAPIVTTLGVTAGRAHADPPASKGASSNSSIKAAKPDSKKNK